MMYRAYGRVLQSDRFLPELERVDEVEPDLRIVWRDGAAAPVNARWDTLWRFSNGEPWVSVARTADAHHLRFNRFADVRIAGGLIDLWPRGHAREAMVRHLLLDQVLPVALAAGGALVLHASAVRLGECAILLAGKAGAGKSTLAALLAASGWAVMADDGVLLDVMAGSVTAVPSYPGLRLWPDACALAGVAAEQTSPVAEHTGKRRVVPESGAPGFSAGPARVHRVYVLSPDGDRFAIVRRSRRDASVDLVRYMYRADVAARRALHDQFHRIVECCAALDVWRVSLPRDTAAAVEAARAIAAHARGV